MPSSQWLVQISVLAVLNFQTFFFLPFPLKASTLAIKLVAQKLWAIIISEFSELAKVLGVGSPL